MNCKKCGKELPEESSFCCYCGVPQKPRSRRKTRPNGSGTVYQRGNKWQAEFSVYVDGVRCRAYQGGFRTKREALDYLPYLKEKALEPKPESTQYTVEKVYEMLIEKWFPTLSYDKASHYRTAWRSIAAIHKSKLANLRYADLQPLIDNRAGGYYPKRDVKALLRKIYNLAIKLEVVDKDYAALLDLPPLKETSRKAFTVEEVGRMWADYEAGNKFTRYFLIMCYTGMRTGEMRSIRKENVNLSKQYCTGGIKTEAGKARQIPLCDRIMPLVRECYAEGIEQLCECGENEFYRQWNAMAERCGLTDADPYSCRHTAATLLATEGVAPAVIKEIMGHTDYSMTLSYTHMPLEEKVGAVNRLQ